MKTALIYNHRVNIASEHEDVNKLLDLLHDEGYKVSKRNETLTQLTDKNIHIELDSMDIKRTKEEAEREPAQHGHFHRGDSHYHPIDVHIAPESSDRLLKLVEQHDYRLAEVVSCNTPGCGCKQYFLVPQNWFEQEMAGKKKDGGKKK